VAKKTPFEKIVLVIDATEAGLRAAEFAIEVGGYLASHITGISVIDTETLRQLLMRKILVPAEMKEFEVELEESARRHLRTIQQMAAKKKVEMEMVLAKGSVHTAVLAECRRRNADLIIMGSPRQASGKKDLVARERQLILEHSTCPVLLVP